VIQESGLSGIVREDISEKVKMLAGVRGFAELSALPRPGSKMMKNIL
jgi:hypothetical protein